MQQFKIGDLVKKTKFLENSECYAGWLNMSNNSIYEIEFILPSGMIVLKNYLVLVNPCEIEAI